MDNPFSDLKPSDLVEFAFVLGYRKEISQKMISDRTFVTVNYTNENSIWRYTNLEDAFEKIRTITTPNEAETQEK